MKRSVYFFRPTALVLCRFHFEGVCVLSFLISKAMFSRLPDVCRSLVVESVVIPFARSYHVHVHTVVFSFSDTSMSVILTSLVQALTLSLIHI